MTVFILLSIYFLSFIMGASGFYFFNEMKEIGRKVSVLEEQLLLKTAEVEHLKELLQKQMPINTQPVSSTFNDYIPYLIIGGVAIVTIGTLVYVFFPYSHLVSLPVGTTVHGFLRPTVQFVDQGNNTITVEYVNESFGV